MLSVCLFLVFFCFCFSVEICLCSEANFKIFFFLVPFLSHSFKLKWLCENFFVISTWNLLAFTFGVFQPFKKMLSQDPPSSRTASRPFSEPWGSQTDVRLFRCNSHTFPLSDLLRCVWTTPPLLSPATGSQLCPIPCLATRQALRVHQSRSPFGALLFGSSITSLAHTYTLLFSAQVLRLLFYLSVFFFKFYNTFIRGYPKDGFWFAGFQMPCVPLP